MSNFQLTECVAVAHAKLTNANTPPTTYYNNKIIYDLVCTICFYGEHEVNITFINAGFCSSSKMSNLSDGSKHDM